MEWIQWSYLRVCLLQLYAYEYKCVTDLEPISITGILAPFAVHVHCHMIAYVPVINNVCCIQKDLRHQLLYYCWRPPRRSDDIRNMFFLFHVILNIHFLSHVYLLFGVIYAMTCMYIYGNKAFWNWIEIDIIIRLRRHVYITAAICMLNWSTIKLISFEDLANVCLTFFSTQ